MFCSYYTHTHTLSSVAGPFKTQGLKTCVAAACFSGGRRATPTRSRRTSRSLPSALARRHQPPLFYLFCLAPALRFVPPTLSIVLRLFLFPALLTFSISDPVARCQADHRSAGCFRTGRMRCSMDASLCSPVSVVCGVGVSGCWHCNSHSGLLFFFC